MNEIYIQLSDVEDQTPFDTAPYKVRFNTQDRIQGITHALDSASDIVIEEDGVYVLVSAGQVGRRTGSLLRHIDMWIRVNNEDIPNSSVRASAPASLFKGDTTVLVAQNALSLQAGDIINIMMSVSEKGEGLGLISMRPGGQPTIPGIIFTMHKL